MIVDGGWSDRLMIHTLNLHVTTLPKSHWLIHANVDEFFDFPCDIMQRIALGQQLFCMCMRDQMASTGRVSPLALEPSIQEQYPLGCYIRPHLRGANGGVRTIGGTNTGKIALMLVASSPTKGRRVFKSPHSLFFQFGKEGRCHTVGHFAHYSMTTQYVEAIRQKLKRFQWADAVRNDYTRQLAFLEQHALPGADLRRHPWCAAPPEESACERAIEVIER